MQPQPFNISVLCTCMLARVRVPDQPSLRKAQLLSTPCLPALKPLLYSHEPSYSLIARSLNILIAEKLL